MKMNKINFKQKKYILPLITFPFSIYICYVLNGVGSENDGEEIAKVEELSRGLGTDEDIEGIWNKREAYENSYRYGEDGGVGGDIGEEEEDSIIALKNSDTLSQRTLDSLRAISQMSQSLNKVREIQNSYYNSNNRGGGYSTDNRRKEEDNYDKQLKILNAIKASNNDEKEVLSEPKESPQKWRDEQLKVMRQQMIFADSLERSKDPDFLKQQRANELNKVNQKARDFYFNSTLKVSKQRGSNKFNSINKNSEDSFIRAVVDENIKGYLGSRLKIRLIDDVYVGNVKLDKGTSLFALITGFEAQRVKLSIVSVLYKNQVLPINLSIWDSDGMEGLYVPSSAFREMTKQMGNSIVQGQNINMGGDFFGSMLSNVYRSTSSTIANVLRQNKASIKFNTHIYLIDANQMEKTKNEIYNNKGR